MFRRGVDLDEVGDEVGKPFDRRVGDERELGVVAHRRSEQEPEGGAVLGDEAEVRDEAFLHPFPSGGGGGSRKYQLVGELRVHIVDQLAVERALRRKMLIEDRLRHPGGFGNVLHRG